MFDFFGNKEKDRILKLRQEMGCRISAATQTFEKENAGKSPEKVASEWTRYTTKMALDSYNRSKEQPYPSEWNFWLNANTNAISRELAYSEQKKKLTKEQLTKNLKKELKKIDVEKSIANFNLPENAKITNFGIIGQFKNKNIRVNVNKKELKKALKNIFKKVRNLK